MSLSDSQRQAVERTNQDVCVVAGPGAGKTRVLIERFAWLVEFHNINPSRILAITFTEKAATEIKERLIKRFADNPEHREAIERAWVSTIDGFCARLLQENAIAANIAPDFSVLEPTTAARLARESAEESLDELFRERPAEMRRLLEALDISTDEGHDLAKTLLEVYESQRLIPEHRELEAVDVWPEARRLARKVLEDRGKIGTETSELRDWAAKFLALPDELGKDHFALELTAHLGRVGKTRAEDAKLLKSELIPALHAQWIATWNRDLVDLLREALGRLDRAYRKKKRDLSSLDFADLEEDAIRLLEDDFTIREATKKRFDQILMDELQDTNHLQWRLVNLIRNPGDFFAVGDVNQSIYGFRHADPAVFKDYRDRLEGTVDDLRENYRSGQAILDAVGRVLDHQTGIEPRPLIAAKESEAIVERLVGETPEMEATLIASRILALNCDFKDVAILVRSLNALEPITEALDQFGIPFVTSGGRTFLEAREIRDMRHLLAALVNPLDEIALVGVLRSPLVGLTDQEILGIGKQGWQELFQAQFGHLRKQAGFVSADRLLDHPLFLSRLNSRARANVEKLFSWLRRQHPRPLAEILEDLELLQEPEAPPPEAGDVVRLMSIHAAKGLEFKVVFVSALQRGADRSSPVVAFSEEYGLGAKWRNPATGESLGDTAYMALKKERRRREDEEENRLLYVAMTRAEERLFLTYTQGKNSRGWQKLVESTVPQGAGVVEAPERAKMADVEAIRFVDPLVVAGQPDSTAAVTSVAVFDVCPRKYFLERYVGVEPNSDEPGTGAMSLGTEVHRILAGGTSDMAEALELAGRAPVRDGATREFDFVYAIDDMVLRGQIDAFYEEDGKLVLVDYKTDREELPENYALQLRIYALALERYLGRLPDRAILFYLRTGREVGISISLENLEGAQRTVRRLIEAQRTMVFTLQEGEHCRRCAFYRGLCPAGR